MATLTQSPSLPRRALLAEDAKSEQVQPCDFRTVGGIDKPRLDPLVTATETFAGPFAQKLQSKLGLPCETSSRPSEQILCKTFLEKAANSYLVPLQLGAQGDIAFLQIDSMLLFPVIDRLLGGTGGPSELSREVTEIEDLIAKEFVRLICQELQTAWRSFGISVSAAARKPLAQLQTLFTASDTALVFGFSVSMQSAGGDFQLMLPIASLGPFLGAGTVTASDVSRKGTMTAKLADKLLGTTFGVELALLGCKVSATDLLNLSVGKILQLGVSVRTPAILKIEGHDSFDAVPVRTGNHRGAQLLNRKSQRQPETETTI
jgi:flagellar motor switch protein FliM